MESDKAILIESDPDLQSDAENQQASVNIVPSNEQPPPPYDEVAAGLQEEQHLLRRPARDLVVRRNESSWNSIDCSIVLACIAFLFCGIFGIVAVVLAFYCRSLWLNVDLVKFRRMIRSSFILSVSGILIIIFLILVLGIVYVLKYLETYRDVPGYMGMTSPRMGERSTSIDYKRWEASYNVSDDGCGSLYNVQACEAYGSYKDYYNCTKCCPAIANGRCTYGWAHDSNGCRFGCCGYYDNSSCLSNGFYFSSYDGCKQCCSRYNVLDCMRFGSYMYSGCLQCCRYFNSRDCTYGWKLDSNGCKRCCYYYTADYPCSRELVTVPSYMEMMSPRMGENTTSIDYKREGISIGYNMSDDGCGSLYDVQACETYGSYKNYYHCTKCCPAIANGKCTHGWAKDHNGCRFGCCGYYDNSSCLSNGFYFSSYDGCKQCCSRRNVLDCMRFGSYMYSGCLQCCSYFNSRDCSYGWKLDSNGCKTCCYYRDEYTCSHELVTVPGYMEMTSPRMGENTTSIDYTREGTSIGYNMSDDGCGSLYDVQACETYGSYKDYYNCTKCCPAIADGRCTYGWAQDSNGCRRGCCPYYNNASCEAYGSYIQSYPQIIAYIARAKVVFLTCFISDNGCKKCCSYYNVADCKLFSTYYDGETGCRLCSDYIIH